MSGRTKKRSLVLMEGQVGDPHMRVMSDHADMTASLTMASTIDSTTLCENDPKIFQRSGKWSVEEEAFANRLIFEFENGILADCEDGCTLRSYLARKLRCAPMRISKKFAGRCIGKVCQHKCMYGRHFASIVSCMYPRLHSHSPHILPFNVRT
jgi:hypothetical protein